MYGRSEEDKGREEKEKEGREGKRVGNRQTESQGSNIEYERK